MFLNSFQFFDIAGHIVAKPGQIVAKGWPTIGHAKSNSLKSLEKNMLYHKKSPFSSIKPLFLHSKNALQHQLRQVCENDRPEWAKPAVLLPRLSNLSAFASDFAQRFGTLLRSVWLGAILASPVLADGWTSSATTTAWSSADRFTSQAAAPNVSPQSRSILRIVQQSDGPAMDRLLTLISLAESPVHGYDSVNHGARVKPPKRPSQMTIAEIQRWVRATPGQPHAIGRNQIIPKTFNRLVRALGLSGSTVYNRRTQDLMGRYLIEEAGYSSFIAGRISRTTFMDQLAKVWAGLPLANGRSAYHGYAGNRATITRAEYTSAMAEIFPVRRASK